MTQENKGLLLKDLCARLPYGVICERLGKHYPLVEVDIKRELVYLLRDDCYVPYSILRGDIIKPYLRSMDSMTPEEQQDWIKYSKADYDCEFKPEPTLSLGDCHLSVDWLNANHFDYRGLILRGLALEALDGMYNI